MNLSESIDKQLKKFEKEVNSDYWRGAKEWEQMVGLQYVLRTAIKQAVLDIMPDKMIFGYNTYVNSDNEMNTWNNCIDELLNRINK